MLFAILLFCHFSHFSSISRNSGLCIGFLKRKLDWKEGGVGEGGKAGRKGEFGEEKREEGKGIVKYGYILYKV